MICIECGGSVFNGGELCDDCMEINGLTSHQNVRLSLSSQPQNTCLVCMLAVQVNDSRQCSNCSKFLHTECDSSEAGLEGFICVTCRSNPMVADGDVMLTSANNPLSPFNDGASAVPQISLSGMLQRQQKQHSVPQSQNEYSGTYQPHHPNIATHSQITEETSDGATNDSAQNSPFYTENSDYDEDFVPSSSRGRGRGGAKKKPGRGQSLLKRQQTMPPSGLLNNQLQTITQPSVRGKRGKRGAKAPGKGGGRGRGRGRAAALAMQQPSTIQALMQAQQQIMQPFPSNQFQAPSQAMTIREVDEHLIEDESSRQSAATRADDAEYVRTIVVANSKDPFLSKTCLCLVCGAIGKGPESSMVACSNCAQTYHTYCVGLHDKINSTVIFRGWRCLDCTVCEGCGNGGDESKLLLCEECDVSYHIYCLRPPLEKIPSGPWRCQWCARCRRCTMKVSSGSDLTRDGLCHPCNSLRKCSRCAKPYALGDKLIRCSQCSKWQHGFCENLLNDEMLEQAAMNRMRCTSCRPNKISASMGFGDGSNVVICDNVALSKSADEVLKSKFMPSLVRPAYENYGYRDSFDHYGNDDDFNPIEEVENFVVQRGRGRGNPGGRRGMNRIGIGGFYAKLPRHRVLALTEEAAALNNMDEEDLKKLKRPRKPRRSQLEDAYPPAIQEAFFGIKAVEGKALVDISVEEPSLAEYGNGKMGHSEGTGHELSTEATEMLRNDINENDILEGMDLHDMDADIDKVDLSLLFDDDYDEDFEDSLGGLEMDDKGNGDIDDKSFKPTSFSMDETSMSNPQNQQQNQPVNPLYPNEANNYAMMNPAGGARAGTLSRSASSNNPDAPERYQFSERWEEDEPLGLQATTAAVLYANEKHGHLKEQYPEWVDRVKQIQRLWRTLSAEERQEYVNRARENRTNRGRHPRPRKNNTQSNSVESPTVQSPAPGQMARDGFKVPQVPGGNGTPLYDQEGIIQPQVMKQYRITCHLTPDVHQQYRQIKEKRTDLDKIVQAMEIDLSKQRKQKKNLAAKKRQMVKTAQSAPDYDGRLIDLNDADKLTLEQLTDSIKVLQGELDNSRREIKTHESTMREFEMKHMILRNENEVTPQMIEQTNLLDEQAAAQDNARLHIMRQQQMIQMQQQQQQMQQGVPQQVRISGPNVPPQVQMRPGMPPGPIHGPPGVAPYGMLPRPGMTPQQHQEMQRRINIQHQNQMRCMRSAVLGGVRLDSIKNNEEREAYEVLDDIIFNVARVFDGPPRENIMLKRLLDPNVPPPVHQMAQQVEHIEPPRPKKKRTIQKKAAQPYTAGSEYEAWVEKIHTRFRLCHEIPKRAKEPPLKNPGAAFAELGITNINVRCDRRAISGNGFGEMNLSYMDDYYTGDDRTSRVLSSKCLSMNDIVPHQILPALYGQRNPDEDDYVFDEVDRKAINFHPLSVLSNWINSRNGGALEHMRSQTKTLDVPRPIEPLRRMFYAESTEEDVEVFVTMREMTSTDENGETKRGVNEMVEQLKDILGIKRDIGIKIEDTPPMSPTILEEIKCEKDIKTEIDDGSDTPTSSGIVQREIKKEAGEVQAMCKQCSKEIEGVSMVRQKMGKLGLLPADATENEKEEMAFFCSMKCYFELMATSKMPLSHEEINAAESHVDEETFNRLKQIHSDNIVKAVAQGRAKLPCVPSVSMEGLISPKDTRYMMDEGRKEMISMIPVSSLSNSNEQKVNEPPKILSEEVKAYSHEIYDSFANLQILQKGYINAPKMGVPVPPYGLDQRQCVLCGNRGDGETSKCGRLLSLTEYFWVHVNCALWSTEVFENQTGGLVHVDRAVIRSSSLLCAVCTRPGASIKCHKMDCPYNFHVLCAQETNGYFIKDRTFICRHHESIAPEVTVQRLDALRRIYIQRDENELLSRMFELTDGPKLCLRLGSFSFFNVGHILPDQLKTFHNTSFLFPNGYNVIRWFWSPNEHKARMQYECSISDKDGHPWFTVKSLEDPEMCYSAESATLAWQPIFERISQNRGTVDMLRFFGNHISGETLFGLNEAVISKITESLPGVDSLFTYTFRHANSPLLELPLALNPMGCARAEPRSRNQLRHHKTRPAHNGPVPPPAAPSTSSSSVDTYRMGRTRGVRTNYADEQAVAQIKALGLAPEYAALYLKGMEPIQGNQQAFTAYQKMRREWKNTVYLAKSKIQGLGLYAKHDISMGDFIIEYKGEIIRSEVCEVREKRYNAQNRGVYMFRIDEEWVIDATMAGGPARYINHSCDPNCSTRILNAGSTAAEKKIIVTANRPIMANEELTYDYQFELEDSTDKIPCLCGAPNCVKWMN